MDKQERYRIISKPNSLTFLKRKAVFQILDFGVLIDNSYPVLLEGEYKSCCEYIKKHNLFEKFPC